MKDLHLQTTIKVYSYDELDPQLAQLVDVAKSKTQDAYCPYSHFHVGAAVQLENDVIVTGTNQENAAYPSGLCAERTALFYANSQYPNIPVKALAIAAYNKEEGIIHNPISPCGSCRQIMLETEKRFGKPMRILLCGSEEVYIVENATNLLPLAFSETSL